MQELQRIGNGLAFRLAIPREGNFVIEGVKLQERSRAKKAVTPDSLAPDNALEKERVRPVFEAAEGADRRERIADEPPVDRDEVHTLSKLFEGGEVGEVGGHGGDGCSVVGWAMPTVFGCCRDGGRCPPYLGQSATARHDGTPGCGLEAEKSPLTLTLSPEDGGEGARGDYRAKGSLAPPSNADIDFVALALFAGEPLIGGWVANNLFRC